MKKTLPLAVVCAALGLALTACGSGQNGGQTPPLPPSRTARAAQPAADPAAVSPAARARSPR